MHRKTLVASTVAAALAIGIAACSPTPTGPDESVLRLSSPSTVLALGAHKITEGNANLLAGDALYDHLWIQTGATDYEPWAAESFEYNDDRTVLSITLRDDIVFADGTEFDATDLEAAIAYYNDPATKLFTGLTPTVEVTGEHSLVVTLDKPSRMFLTQLSGIALAPAEVWKDPEAFATEATGSGPYVLDMENTTLNAVYSFIRNPDYWNPDAFPYDRLEITLLPDLTARLNALKSGQIDLADVDSATAADAESAGFDIQEYAVATVILNLGDRRGELLPAIGDVRVRRAIAEAIDRESIATTLENGFASPVNQAYSEMDPGFQADRVDENPFDPEQARELLAEAGYPDGFDLSIPSYGPVTGKYEAYVQQALADIGIRVTYLPMTDDNWLTEFMSGTYPVILHGELLSQIDDMADPGYWWNPWHNESPQTDELLSILNSGTEDEALAAYRELGAIMLDEVWFAPLTQPLTLVATSSAIEVPATAWAGSISLKDIHPAS